MQTKHYSLFFFFYSFYFTVDSIFFFVFTQQNDENRRLHGNIVRVKCSIKLNVAENATLFVESVCEMHRERSSRVSWPESGQVVMETEKEGSLYKIVPRNSTSLCCSAFLNGGISSGYLTNFTLIHWLDFDVTLLPFFFFFILYFLFFFAFFRKLDKFLDKSTKRLRLNIFRTWILLRSVFIHSSFFHVRKKNDHEHCVIIWEYIKICITIKLKFLYGNIETKILNIKIYVFYFVHFAYLIVSCIPYSRYILTFFPP